MLQEYLCEVINPEYKKLVDTIAGYIENNGGQVSFVSLPHTELAIPCYNVICAAEVSSNMAKFTGLPFGKLLCFHILIIFSYNYFCMKVFCMKFLFNIPKKLHKI